MGYCPRVPLGVNMKELGLGRGDTNHRLPNWQLQDLKPSLHMPSQLYHTMDCSRPSLCKLFLVAPEVHHGENAILEHLLDFEVRAWNKAIPWKSSVQLVQSVNGVAEFSIELAISQAPPSTSCFGHASSCIPMLIISLYNETPCQALCQA